MDQIMASAPIDPKYRDVLERLMLLFAGLYLLFFLLNVVNGYTTISVIELISTLFALWLYYRIKYIQPYGKLLNYATIFVLNIVGVMLYSSFDKQTSITSYTWIYTIPVISYLLLGTKRGFFVTLMTTCIMLVNYFLSFKGNQLASSLSTLSNIVMSFATVWLLSHTYEAGNANTKRHLKHQAHTDALTGLLNRYSLQLVFDRGVVANKYNIGKVTQAIIVLDIDFFKRINDKYGHDVGDQVLVIFSQVLKQYSTDSSRVFRLGGEEFCILLPNYTSEQALKLAQDILNYTKQKGIMPLHPEIRLSFSAGVACYPGDGKGLSQILNSADRRMYLAKEAGKGMVIGCDSKELEVAKTISSKV